MTCAEADATVNTEEAASATTTATENLKHRAMLMARRPEADPDKDHCCCRQRSSWPESSKSWRITYQGAARHHPWRRIAERTVCPLSQRHYSHRAPRKPPICLLPPFFWSPRRLAGMRKQKALRAINRAHAPPSSFFLERRREEVGLQGERRCVSSRR